MKIKNIYGPEILEILRKSNRNTTKGHKLEEIVQCFYRSTDDMWQLCAEPNEYKNDRSVYNGVRVAIKRLNYDDTVYCKKIEGECYLIKKDVLNREN